MRESYDAVLLFDVLEHIKDTRPFVESILFHLRKGGYLFVNVPAGQSLFSRYDDLQGHFRRYNKSSIVSEFDQLPVDICDVRYWGITNIPLVLLRKLWCVSLGRQKSDEEVFKKGFKPPNRLINNALSTITKFELGVLPKASVGTSLLAVIQKQ
jgi:hypothetical protein